MMLSRFGIQKALEIDLEELMVNVPKHQGYQFRQAIIMVC
jgi:hypothetical protein